MWCMHELSVRCIPVLPTTDKCAASVLKCDAVAPIFVAASRSATMTLASVTLAPIMSDVACSETADSSLSVDTSMYTDGSSPATTGL